MKGFSLAFYLGIQLCLQLTELPDIWIYPLIPLCFFFLSTSGLYRCLGVVILGFLYAVIYSSILIVDRFPESFSGEKFTIIGKIIDLPEKNNFGVRFIIKIDELIDENEIHHKYKGRARLSWRGADTIPETGQIWQLRTKLKTPHGFANPGSFDYEFKSFHQKINVTGYVITSGKNELLTDSVIPSIHNLRMMLNYWLDDMTNSHHLTGLVKALLIGTRSSMKTEQWEVLRKTGTSHLMAISGLHIGLIAMLFYALTNFCCRLLPVRNSNVIIQQYSLAISFVAASIYALLAGFSLPTQRALMMLFVVYLALLSNRKYSVFDILGFAAFLVMLYDPLAVLTASFYLSFIAVFLVLLASVYRIRERNHVRDSVRIQLAISLGLAPLAVYFFKFYPLLSLPANLVAVPVMSFLILPGLILSFLMSLVVRELGNAFMSIILLLFDWLWWFLASCAAIEPLQWQSSQFQLVTMILIYVMVLLILMPAFFQRRYLIMTLILAAVLSNTVKIETDEFKMTVLDVGQGLSIVIQIRDYVLLYDAGPALSESFNTGKMAVIPYLLNNNIEEIDTFIISHQDNDHAGGSEAVAERFDVKEFISDVSPNRNNATLKSCQANMNWTIHDARFEILHPDSSFQGNRNNRSCVLKISYQDYSILIPGDIEASAERHLLNVKNSKLIADILIAPHHGSASSSTTEFIEAVKPGWVIFSSGYQNRYKFPKQVIIERYKKHEIEMLETSNSGAISINISKTGLLVERYRDKYRRFWHHSI